MTVNSESLSFRGSSYVPTQNGHSPCQLMGKQRHAWPLPRTTSPWTKYTGLLMEPGQTLTESKVISTG